jgi:hypothetical protein
MALIIGDNFYTTTALHTKKGEKRPSEGGQIHGSETMTRTQHRNNCIAKKEEKKRCERGSG